LIFSCPAAKGGGAETKPKKSLGRGGKKKGCGENEFPPRPRRRRKNFAILLFL
jgi:hypothetical protein